MKYAGVDLAILSLLSCTVDTGGLGVETAALVVSEANCVAKFVLVAVTFIRSVVISAVGLGTVKLCCVLSKSVLLVLLYLVGIVGLFEVFILVLIYELLYKLETIFSCCAVAFLLFCVILCTVVSFALWIVAGLVKVCRAKESAIRAEHFKSNLLHRSMVIQMSFVPFKKDKNYIPKVR